jgi:putative ABC transport system permease protein
MVNLSLAWRNLRQYRSRLLALLVATILGSIACLVSVAFVGKAADATQRRVAEGTALRTIEIRQSPQRTDLPPLTSANLAKLATIEHVGSVEPSLQASFGIKTDEVPGALLYGTVVQNSRRPPIVASSRPAVFPLKAGEAVLPARSQGMDLRSLLGRSVPVTATRQVADGQGSPLDDEIQVVGLYDETYADDGPSAAYVDSALVVRWAAAKAGVPDTDFLAVQGYASANLVVDQADHVPATVTKVRELGFGAVALASRLTDLPASLRLLRTFAYVVLGALMLFSLVTGFVLAGSFVSSRTKELGVLKALGFSRRRILSILLTEMGIAGLVAGAAGVVLGNLASAGALALLGGTEVLDVMLPEGTGLPDPLWTIGLLVLPVAALLAGALRPACRAAALQPDVALRQW